MKTKRTTFVAFLLCAIMLLGVGFANLTDNLFIKGEATINTTAAQSAFDEHVYFDKAELHTKAVVGVDTATIGLSDNDSVTFHVKSLGKAGDYAMFKFTVKNDSAEFDAKISVDTGYPSTSDTNNFIFEYTDENGDVLTEEVTCKAGQTALLYVKVTLKNSPQVNLTAAFNVNLTATSVTKAA